MKMNEHIMFMVIVSLSCMIGVVICGDAMFGTTIWFASMILYFFAVMFDNIEVH